MRTLRQIVLPALSTRGWLLAAALLIAWLPATHCGFIWDDDVYVTENPLLTAPDGLYRIWFSLDSPSQYFPLVYTTFRVEHGLWGFQAAGYHWDNLLLHLANTFLLYGLLRSLKLPGAWLAAAIWGLHPVQVESVAWVTERKNVLSGFFFLLALRSWVAFLSEKSRRAGIWYAAALLAFALALFAKTTACTLPAALLLISWMEKRPIERRRFWQIAPFVALGVGMGLLTVWWERYHQGTHGKLFSMDWNERLLIASHAIWFYLGKLVWPVPLTFSYPRWTLHPADPLAYGWLAAGIALCIALFVARRFTGRGPATAALFYAATLSPTLGFIMLYTFRYSFVADHYQYLASIGPIALFAAGVAKVADTSSAARMVVQTGMAALLIALGALTWKQCHIYASPETIWRSTLADNPGSLMANFDLGNELMKRGKTEESIARYTRAVEIDPTFIEARCNRAQAFALEGRFEQSRADYAEALRIEPGNAIAENGLGMALDKLGRWDEAAAHFRQAVRSEPDYGLAQKNLGDALAQQGRYAEAEEPYRQLERLLPGDSRTHLTLGRNDLLQGKVADGTREYREALRLDPQSPEILAKLAWLLATAGDTISRAEGVTLAEKARDLTHGKNGEVLRALGAAYAAVGRFPDALAAAHAAADMANQSGDAKSGAAIQAEIRNYEAAKPAGGH